MTFKLLMVALTAYTFFYFGYVLTKRSTSFKEFMRDKAHKHLAKGMSLFEYRGGLSGMVGYIRLSADQKHIAQYILLAMNAKINQEITKEKLIIEFEKTSVIRFSMFGAIRTAISDKELTQVFELLQTSFMETWNSSIRDSLAPPSRFIYQFMVDPLSKRTYTVNTDMPYDETSCSYDYGIEFVIYIS